MKLLLVILSIPFICLVALLWAVGLVGSFMQEV